ncbi:hypothetical protein Gotri_018915 [Gossypium trilobum]|uniref:Uncharacterized protein n=1 Tax=Gossypium trilobum TaxID=34281 RepID=A0A7J9EB89_9ROSI|nr:hypothetical protein [Gossypium trilobum]
MVVVEDVSHKKASQFRHHSFSYSDQLTFIYAKDRATGKDAQTTIDIVEEIDAENLYKRNCQSQTKMILHFQRRKKRFLM